MIQHRILVKGITWIDIEAEEAEVQFEINKKQFLAFSQPCTFEVGEYAYSYIDFIEEDIDSSLFWDYNVSLRSEIIAASEKQWKYYCYGYIENLNPLIVNCGDLKLSLGNWSNDEKVKGHYVYFVISRLDIIKSKK